MYEWRARSVIGMVPEGAELVCKEADEGGALFSMTGERNQITSWLYSWGNEKPFSHMTLEAFTSECLAQLDRVEAYKLNLGDTTYKDGKSTLTYRVTTTLCLLPGSELRCDVQLMRLE